MNLVFKAIDRALDAAEQKGLQRNSQQKKTAAFGEIKTCPMGNGDCLDIPEERRCIGCSDIKLSRKLYCATDCECAQIDEADRLVAAQERAKDQQ